MPSPDAAALLAAFREELAITANLDPSAASAAVEELRRRWTGKQSPLKEALKSLRDIPADQRPAFAKAFNDATELVTTELGAAKERIESAAESARLESEWIDLTLPGTAPRRGARHPLTEVEMRCASVLRQLGFELVDGPEVESAKYNFDTLNIPEHHPARDMQDTFWVTGGLLLRSHTTTVQARLLESRPKLPIRMFSMGRVYRNEAVDATHLAMFHQMEGLWVDKGLTFAHLKGTLAFVAKELFGDRPIRFKPKFYPYTEPSVGVDLQCARCHGSRFAEGRSCEACHGAGWVTILGAGMVHPKVFRGFGYDPDEISGIAFGLGTTRMAGQAAGVSKIKSLYETDLRVHDALARGGR